MFGMKELKPSVEKTETSVECPVKGCQTKVKRMRGQIYKSLDSSLERGDTERIKDFEQYFCKKHRIYITPATFIYENLKDNLLWYDKDIFEAILEVKRVKAQLYHDNSEDAITWNVFRFLEGNKLLSGLLAKLCHLPVKTPEIIYWSYSQSQPQQGVWSELVKASSEFGESPRRRSEPDLIVVSEKALFFIEAKFTATNDTPATKEEAREKAKNPKKYTTGGNNWFEKVFRPESDYKTIVLEQKYELLRFWLIGTWIAEHLSLDFYLVNLVRKGYEDDIESKFGKHIRQNERGKFVRITWEDIYQYIKNSDVQSSDKPIVLGYFENKTTGFKEVRKENIGILQQAFQCPLPETLA